MRVPPAVSPGAGRGGPPLESPALTFSERHRGLALALTIAWLVALGITTGGAVGRLAVQLIGLALSQVGAER